MFYKQRGIFSHPWSILNFLGCCLFFNEKIGPLLLILVSTVCLLVGFKTKKISFSSNFAFEINQQCFCKVDLLQILSENMKLMLILPTKTLLKSAIVA